MKTSFRFLLNSIALAVGIAVLFFFLQVRGIQCFIEGKEQPDFPICQQLQGLRGTPLLFQDFTKNSTVLRSLFLGETKETFYLEKLEVSLNGTVTFFLTQSSPLYRMKQGEHTFLFTSEGEAREDDSRVDVPEVRFWGEQATEFEQYRSFLIPFLQELGEDSKRVEYIDLVSPTRIKLQIVDFPQVLLEPHQDPTAQAQRFRVLLRSLNPREIDVALKEVDLRFDLPVLRVTESSDEAEFLIDSQE